MNNLNKQSPEPEKNPKNEPEKPEPSHNQGDAYKSGDDKKLDTKDKN